MEIEQAEEQETPSPSLESEQAVEPQQQEVEKGEDDENVLQFMDFVDAYLTLTHSLSSTLRQGWLDLASARHSMGASRVNTVLLDHKFHPAATKLLVTGDDGKVDSIEPHFTLCKWGSSGSEKHVSEVAKASQNNLHSQLRQRGVSQISGEKMSSETKASHVVDDQVEKERSKSLSVFGTLVSPKLRAAQQSFETALETLVEIANMRSGMLYSFDKVHEKMAGNKG